MPHYKKGYSPDGTPKPPKPQPKRPKYGPDGFPIPQPTPPPQPQPAPQPAPEPPAFHNEHSCHMDGAFIVFGGYLRIYDNEVPEGTRGHELYLSFGGVGVGGMDGHGVLSIEGDSWEEFYNSVDTFAYIALSPDPDHPDSRMAHTAIVFFDGHHHVLGHAYPDISADIGLAGGSVEVKS